ncbi:type II secretion system protein GspE, partial [Halomonas sp. BBD48]|nr:type II secretion system protein GspE [Halomonas sp. BBD48]
TGRLDGLDTLERIAEPVGCESCDHTGFRGRLGIYEFIAIDDTLAGMIHDGAAESDMTRHAFATHMTLVQCAANRLQAGDTSVDEVLRAIHQ